MYFRSVLSLFDGISGAQVALTRSNHSYGNYYASEIDKHAIKITNFHFPNTIQLGDIKQISKKSLPNDVDLIIGGSPCQSFSFAGKELGFEDERGQLLLEYVRVLKEVKPTYFILENVRMKKRFEEAITELLDGLQPIRINSALVSAQNRNRLYWTNIPNVTQPEDRNLFLSSVLENSENLRKEFVRGSAERYRSATKTTGVREVVDIRKDNKSNAILATCKRKNMVCLDYEKYLNKFKPKKTPSRDLMWYTDKCKNLTPNDKSWAVTTKQDRWNNTGLIGYQDYFRFLTPLECERLQTFPDNYTELLSNTQRYKCIGNSFTIDVITHILNCI